MKAEALRCMDVIILLHSFLSASISLQAFHISLLSWAKLQILILAIFCFKIAHMFSIGQKWMLTRSCAGGWWDPCIRGLQPSFRKRTTRSLRMIMSSMLFVICTYINKYICKPICKPNVFLCEVLKIRTIKSKLKKVALFIRAGKLNFQLS